MEEIVNKVAKSGLLTIDLADYLPDKEEIALFDLKPFLFRGLILKEKDFREALKSHDWQQYAYKWIPLTCTTDAIIPMWAYMLVTTYLKPVAREVIFGNEEDMINYYVLKKIELLDPADFEEKRLVIKGCGNRPVSASAYVAIMKKLQPVVKSLMFGEPCSTVPVYKQKK